MMYELKEINIYPIKSLGGFTIDNILALKEGLQYDRRWMLVDQDGKFMSQRENAQLALFECSLSKSEINVSYQSDSIAIPLNQNEDNLEKVSVWDSEFHAQTIGNVYNKWFSDRLNKVVKLVKMTAKSKRVKKFSKAPFSSEVSMADGYPFLILGEESLRHLNSKLEKEVDSNRFRANFIVSSQIAHEEDLWQKIRIGSAEFLNIKPCARCIMITINQHNANKGAEPLKTLSSYRKQQNKIYFGSNMILIKEGQISIGDKLQFIN